LHCAPYARHPDRDHRAAIRLLLKLSLNRLQHFVGGVAGELVKPARKWPGLDE